MNYISSIYFFSLCFTHIYGFILSNLNQLIFIIFANQRFCGSLFETNFLTFFDTTFNVQLFWASAAIATLNRACILIACFKHCLSNIFSRFPRSAT